MGLLKRIFGDRDPLDRVRKAVGQGSYAEALSLGESASGELSPERRQELENLLVRAGDGLAEHNLNEALACLRAGDRARALEHLELALSQARSEALRARIASVDTQEGSAAQAPPPAATVGHSCSGGCGPAAHSAAGSGQQPDGDLDEETRLELILAGYPEALAEGCRGGGATFRKALLLAHDGKDSEALALFEQVAEGERSAGYYFERGSALLRAGETGRAETDLEKAAALAPEEAVVFESLVGLDLAAGRLDKAASRLKASLEQGRHPGFCHGRLAFVMARQGRAEEALAHARAVSRVEGVDPDSLQVCAGILERDGDLDGAGALLARLGGGGCSSSGNIPLAEFWLRHKMEPPKALEMFKGALRHDPSNPLWHLRIARCYLLLGWNKEAKKIINSLQLTPDASSALRDDLDEIRALLG